VPELDVDGRPILRNRTRRCGLHSCGSEEGPVEDCCKHGNKLSSSIKVNNLTS
jgi:hypothetical protein